MIQIRNPQSVEEGYLVDYGHTTTLLVRMEKGYVKGLTAHFSALKNHYDGGPRFMQLAYRMLVFGTYRWPEDRIEEALRAYEKMTTQTNVFHYATSRFKRSYNPESGWIFTFDYVSKDYKEADDEPPSSLR